MVLHVTVDVKRLFELGRLYPRLVRCCSCNSVRVWGHGYVTRYFEGFIYPLWIRRFRCPYCGAVCTLRPDSFVKGFRCALETILSSLVKRITDHRFQSSIPRQVQQYWHKGLRRQASRTRNAPYPDISVLNALLAGNIIPFTRSFECATLRVRGPPYRLSAAILSSCSGASLQKQEVLMDEDAKREIAVFRFGVIADLVARKLQRGEKERILREKASGDLFFHPQPHKPLHHPLLAQDLREGEEA